METNNNDLCLLYVVANNKPPIKLKTGAKKFRNNICAIEKKIALDVIKLKLVLKIVLYHV